MLNRNLIYIDYAAVSARDVAETLKSRWNIVYANDMREIDARVANDQAVVGVIQFSEQVISAHELHSVMTQLSKTYCYSLWIALLPDSLLKWVQIRKLIASYFYDYFTLPVDWERLSITLGRAYGMAYMANSTVKCCECLLETFKSPSEDWSFRLPTITEARACAEEQAIHAALENTQFNISKSAKMLGVSRNTLYRLLEKHAIDFATRKIPMTRIDCT